jgi:DNA polymerase-3 subunit delta'
MSFDSILGHDRPLRVLRRTLSSGRIPHAYLFWGPEGVGKELVAREMAKALLCADPGALARTQPCGGCPACRKVEAGDHPDLHRLEVKGASIPIAGVRSLQESLAFQSFERGRKVAIIRDAFRMTREASNALLKTLEEPSAGTHIFLLAHHRNQLLPTLVSRCQALRFDPLSEGEVKGLLEARGVPSQVAETLAELSGGCPGIALGQDPGTFAALDAEVGEAWVRLPKMGAAERFGLKPATLESRMARLGIPRKDLGSTWRRVGI